MATNTSNVSEFLDETVRFLKQKEIILNEDEMRRLFQACELDASNAPLSLTAALSVPSTDELPPLWPSLSPAWSEFSTEHHPVLPWCSFVDLNNHNAYSSTGTPRTPFQPSDLAMMQQGLLCDKGSRSTQAGFSEGMVSTNYKGKHKTSRSLPNHENCSVWIVGIPAHATYTDIFACINVGKVVMLHVNEPTPHHPTKAAQLRFAAPIAAARFIHQGSTYAGIKILGNRISIKYNRNGDTIFDDERTRVLLITGPSVCTTVAHFQNFFWRKIYKHDDMIRYHPGPAAGLTTLEWHFGRILNQAESAKMAIEREPAYQGIFSVIYGVDPCGLQWF